MRRERVLGAVDWVAAVAAVGLIVAAAGCSSESGGRPSTDGVTSTTQVRSGEVSRPTDRSSVAEISSANQVMGVLQADGGSFDGHTLELTGVDDDLVWFSDRPVRSAGSLSTARLDQAFFADQAPPNAALEISGAPAASDVVILELSDPSYDAKDASLRFTTKVVRPDTAFQAVHGRLVRFADRADEDAPKTFGAAALFIDAAALPTETSDQATVAQLADEYQTLHTTWAEAIINFQACFRKYKNNATHETLMAVGIEFENFLPLFNLIAPLQEAVADGGSLTADQQQQVTQLQNAIPNQKKLSSMYLAGSRNCLGE